MNSYLAEIMVFNAITSGLKKQSKDAANKYLGFPKCVSSIVGTKSAEILMEALGPNLRKYLRECPGGVFSKPTILKIIIQLVSN